MTRKNSAVLEDEVSEELELADEIPTGKRRGRGPGIDVKSLAEKIHGVSPKAVCIHTVAIPTEKPEKAKDDWNAEEAADRKARGRAATLKKHFSPYGITIVARANKVWAQAVVLKEN